MPDSTKKLTLSIILGLLTTMRREIDEAIGYIRVAGSNVCRGYWLSYTFRLQGWSMGAPERGFPFTSDAKQHSV